jgi:hypothetical protein
MGGRTLAIDRFSCQAGEERPKQFEPVNTRKGPPLGAFHFHALGGT